MTTENCWSEINVNTLLRRCRNDVYAWRAVDMVTWWHTFGHPL